jgi:hypothetical protein
MRHITYFSNKMAFTVRAKKPVFSRLEEKLLGRDSVTYSIDIASQA